MEEIKKTPLFENHKKLGGNIVNFNGFFLPVFYTSINEEHNSVRNNTGIFDVSHMGNVIITSNTRDEAVSFFNYLFPNDFSKIKQGKCIYTTMLNEKGTVIDDLIVMCISDTNYHIIVNASNIEKDFNWMKSHNDFNPSVKIENKSGKFSNIAIQGPDSKDLLQNEFNFNISDLKYFNVCELFYGKEKILLSKTGYTGEEGYEIIIANEFSPGLFDELLEKGSKYKIKPCGLGARDTLRLEAALPLYGHELDDEHYPLQTNISFSVKLNKECDFIGKSPLLEKAEKGFTEKLYGFEVIEKAIPRSGMEIITKEGDKAGYVTSGSFSPSLQKNIGLAFINNDLVNTGLQVKIRKKLADINILKLPFYKRK